MDWLCQQFEGLITTAYAFALVEQRDGRQNYLLIYLTMQIISLFKAAAS
jgi:hypothetical protein